ncbi:MAG TPA: hypothetical protein VII99_03300, partial [Bacteroidia bacterium]
MKQGKKEKNKKQLPSLKKENKKQERIIAFVIFIFAFLLYSNTLSHSYALDDDVVYVKNRDVQAGVSGIGSILRHSFIYGFTGHNDQSYRPIVLIFYAIEKEIFGKENKPHVGHFINVLLFSLSCVLLYKLLKKLFLNFSSPIFKWNGVGGGALLITLLFAAHPIHTEAVANIKGRDDILNFIFLELTLYFVLKHIDEKENIFFAFSVLFFFFSLLCKEMAVTFLAIIPLTVFVFRNVSMKNIVVGTLSFAGVFLLYMFIRSSVLESVTFAEK